MNYKLLLVTPLLFIAATALPQSTAGSAAETKVSPVSMSANSPGFEVTSKLTERWVTQTELSFKHMELLGVRVGTLDETQIRGLLESELDSRARHFAEFVDRNVLRNERSAGPKGADGFASMGMLASLDAFIKDAVDFGGFDAEQKTTLVERMKGSEQPGPAGVEAATIARKMLSDSRQGAMRFSRGYRQLVEVLRKELDGREMTPSIGMILEVRAPARQPTISPLAHVTMKCSNQRESAPVLVFDQKKRECNDSGVCRIESTAPVSKGRDYQAVYSSLQQSGRIYLDGCTLNTVLLVDGVEVVRPLPGKFTATGLPKP